MITDFKRRIFEAECPEKCKTDGEKDAWLTAQPWYDANKAYCSLFEHFEPKEIGRQRYIEALIEGHKPSFGYVMLANLMATGYINTIITTNFDDLVYSACTTFTDIRPIVYAYGVLASEMRVTARRPKVLKLHGDYLYSALKNTGPEIETQDLNMARQVSAVLNEYGLIVVGYGGNDQSVMRILSQIPAKNDLYWCVRTSDEPNQMVKELLAAKGGFLVKTDGFDETMNEIRGIVGFDVTAMLGSIRKRQDEMIDQLKRFAPDNKLADVLSGVAQALEKQTPPPKAEERKRRAFIYFAEAVAAESSGTLEDAEKAYRNAIDADPDDAAAYTGLGNVLSRDASRFLEAEAAHRSALKIDPFSSAAHYNLGNVLSEDPSRAQEAEAAYRRALELDPKDATPYNNLGLLLAKDASRAGEAEAAYRKAIELEPNHANPYYNLGCLLQEAVRRAPEAEAAFRRVIELEPADSHGYSGLSLFLRQQGRESEALPLLQKLLRLEPRTFDTLLALAAVNKKLGDSGEYAEFATEARSLAEPDDWYNLACLESVCGNADKAIEYLRCAAEAGKLNREWAWKDPDLEWIRDDPRFKEIVGEEAAGEPPEASAPE